MTGAPRISADLPHRPRSRRRTNCRSPRDSILKIGLWSNPSVYVGIAALVALQLGFIYLPFMQSIFGTASLNTDALLKAVAAALIVLPVISVEKWFRQRRGRAEAPSV